MFLAFLTLTLLAILVGAVACFVCLPLLAAIGATVIGVPLLVWLTLLLFGLWKKAQPPRPFDAAEQERDASSLGGEGRHVRLPDGRTLEYLVYGSKRPDAKVIVQMHGQGASAGMMCKFNASLCEELNLKGIAPSLPGHAFSDIHVDHTIVGFPKDLEMVLEAEGVGEFMVEGMSLGTAHAMAIARHFGPDRCVALGLNVRYLPEQVCREFGFQHDADHLPRPDARTWYQAWNFVVAEIAFRAPLLSPMARHMHHLSDGRRTQRKRPWVFEALGRDNDRTVVRGSQGQGYEFLSYEKLALWGFDPREIETKNVAVWYAMDDSQSPPSHGEWLAELFRSTEGVKTNIRCETAGFGHFTYTPSLGPEFKAEEETMPKALLRLCERR
jgi:pimeloyl-ACP methyl ester carboxylesterase